MARSRSGATFVISLDFELYWGLRDGRSLAACRDHLEGTPEVVERLLDLFEQERVHATWATVGWLYAENAEEALGWMPTGQDRRPASAYGYLAQLPRDGSLDRYHFAKDLVARIAATPGQELATHTLSHYTCLESDHTLAGFRHDLRLALRVAARRGSPMESIVFPRNQWSDAALRVCREEGVRFFRGTLDHWLFRPRASEDETGLRRAMRLADAYVGLDAAGLAGERVAQVRSHGGLVNVPASRFLRPIPKSAPLRALRLRRVLSEMREAAERGGLYHLWWHPHNFGLHPRRSLEALRAIVGQLRLLRAQWGMRSLTMAEAGRAFVQRPERAASSERLSL